MVSNEFIILFIMIKLNISLTAPFVISLYMQGPIFELCWRNCEKFRKPHTYFLGLPKNAGFLLKNVEERILRTSGVAAGGLTQRPNMKITDTLTDCKDDNYELEEPATRWKHRFNLIDTIGTMTAGLQINTDYVIRKG